MYKFLYILLSLNFAVALQGQTTRVQDICLDGGVYRYTISGPQGMLYHWRIENGVFATTDTLSDTIYVKWNAMGRYNLSVYGELDGCFTDERKLTVNINSKPLFTLGDDLFLCEGEKFVFELDTGYREIKWHDESTGRWFTADTAGKIWASVLTRFNCKLSDTVNVQLRPLPIVDLGSDTMLCGNKTKELNKFAALYDGTIYQWRTPNSSYYKTSPSIEVGANAPGEYSVIVTDVNGCVAYDTVRILACDGSLDLTKIMTAITPNGDGKNDFWEIPELSNEYPDVIIDVYDRWGRMVYRSERGYPKPWNGKAQNSDKLLPMDNYYYIINPNMPGVKKVVGTLIIIR